MADDFVTFVEELKTERDAKGDDLSLSFAQTAAITSLRYEGEPHTAKIMLELVLRHEALLAMLQSYTASWWYTTGKTGYECSFCKSMVASGNSFTDPDNHGDDCAFISAFALVRPKD